jgi:hypothetical protein
MGVDLAGPVHTEGHTIFELTFTRRTRFRRVHLVAPAFVQAGAAEVGTTSELSLSDAGPEAPFAAVELGVTGRDGAVAAGLATGEDHLLAVYDGARRRVTLELRTEGRTRVLRRRTVDLPDRFTLGFALCENQATVLVAEGGGWRPLLTERGKVAARLDLREPKTLGDFRYAWGARPGSGPVRVGAARAGLFGMTGLRDPRLVQHADGTPYTRDGKLFLTFTCAGLGFFPQAHWGVFAMDPARPRGLRQVAQLYARRDGLLLGDHAGQIVRDDEHDRWIVANSSWGDFASDGVHVRHTTTTDDLLSGVHLLETEPLAVPTAVSSWDPGMTRIAGAWHVSFVESPSQKPFDFHPALAAAPAGAPWGAGLRLVGAAEDLHQCEGPLLARVGDRFWLLASDGRSRSFPVFDLEMRRVGRLDAPYPSNIPHPQLLRRADGSWLMVTFNGRRLAGKVMGYGGHGDVVILRAAGPAGDTATLGKADEKGR